MLITTALFASVIVAVVGSLLLRSNPARMVNRVLFTCSLNLTTWLLFLHLAVSTKEGLFWLRCACAVGALVPMHFWLVKESVADGDPRWLRHVVRKSSAWIIATAVLTGLPFTEFFIPSHSTGVNRLYGWGYYGYISLNLSLYAVLLIDTFRASRRLSGVRRLELQVWLIGGCVMTTAIYSLMALNSITHDPRYIRLQPLFVLVFYASMAFAITTQRLFDARQIMRVGLHKLALVVLVTGVGYLSFFFFEQFLPAPLAFFSITALALWFAALLNGWLNHYFQFYPQAPAVRQAAYAVARREGRSENLETAFLSTLKGWGQTEHALLLSGVKGPLRGGGLELPGDGLVVETLRDIQWATPERLARERSTPGRLALGRFLAENGLGVVVLDEGSALTVLVGVGVAGSRHPFTYPQVTQLIELASIIENALERAHFSVKAQHAEQLATVGLLGASLAHEIRNPLVSIKAFVQLLPKHHQDPVFREKFFRLIGEEVARIDRLTEQLMELASPRNYTVANIGLHALLNGALDLITPKAEDKQIKIVREFQADPDNVFTDATAAKQVFLNLCFNAIQAAETVNNERWVKISTRSKAAGVELAIEDSGPGIAPDIQPLLFQPFQTTKSTGFGLGLAICNDMLRSLSATITADPPIAGRGATLRVIFPCQPFSS